MAEPRRPRNKLDKAALSKEEMQVMKHLRFGVKTEEGKMQTSTVPYFYGNAIVDCLMRSKYSTKVPPSGSSQPYFPDRKSAVAFLFRALRFGVFVRVERKRRRADRDAEPERGSKLLRKRVAASGNIEKAESGTNTSGKESEAEKEKKEKKDKKEKTEATKKPKRAPKLILHPDQVFVDSDEAMFTWNYDPTRPRNVVLGLLLVLGAIAVCLYPIWPRDVQVYTSYVSRIALVLLGFLLVILLFRYVIAAVVYVITLGRVTFWILPNVDDDKLGFWDSFTPLYSVSYNEASKKKKKDTSSKDGEKSKPKSDSEQPADVKTNEAGEKKRSAKKKAGSGKDSKSETTELPQSTDSKPESAPVSVPILENVEARTNTDCDEEHQFEMINKDEL